MTQGDKTLDLISQRHEQILVLTINRPEQRNALTPELMRNMGRALAEAAQDPEIRCIVLAGAGDRAFCAGMDLKAFAGGQMELEDGKTGLEVFTQQIYPKPIIAAVNGAAVGGGFELMLACDLSVAAEHAVFGLPEVKFGMVAAGGGTRLPRRIPLGVALELALTGDPIDAIRAQSLGLVNRVVPASQVLGEAIRLADRIAANAPLAVAATKKLMVEETGEGTWTHITQTCEPVFTSEDAQEGAKAFTEKRPPQWKGR